MALRAFTRDGVFRAGFGYSGTFYFIRYFGSSSPRNIPAPCRFVYPLTYTISGIERVEGYIRRPPWQTIGDTTDYTQYPYTVVNTNSPPNGTYGNPASDLRCRELGQLVWSKQGSDYSLVYVSNVNRAGAHNSVPNGSWAILQIISGVGIYTLAYAPGSQSSPPRNGWILTEIHINNNNNGVFFRGSLLVR
jgi:hypothetical protein